MIYFSSFASDQGLVRKNNEDFCYALDSRADNDANPLNFGIYIVADGMGGHQAGEVASRTAGEMIIARLMENLIPSGDSRYYSDLLVNAITEANNTLYTMAQGNREFTGMGTTITTALRINDQLYLGHAGDSRAYLFREDEIIRLTEDHSLVANLIKAGMITEKEAKTHPDRNKIYRSLGTAAEITIDTYRTIMDKDSLILRSGDILLFCTDGLHGLLEDSEIQNIVLSSADPYEACQQLITHANGMGGNDNISVVIVKSPVNNGERDRNDSTSTVRMQTGTEIRP